MVKFLATRFSPFKHASFRQFFLVQTISMVGTWSHELARAWIVVEMLGRAAALGLLMISVALPASFLILQGGVLVDRLEVRRVMIITRSILAISSLILAALTEFGHIQLWQLIVFGIIEGTVMSLDSPAEQALRARLVPRSDFQQAIALSSSNFHLARMLGPLVAGFLMAHGGPSLVFLFDGLSYFGLLFVLAKIDLQPPLHKVAPHGTSQLSAISEGFRYLKNNRSIRYRLIQLLLTICFVFPIMMVIFRTFVRQKFDLSGAEFGYVFSLPAFGALAGALTFAFWKPIKPINTLQLSIPMGILSLISVPFMPTTTTTSLAMTVNGFFSYLTFASLTVSIHLDLEEEYRGRISSLIGMCFISIGPIMCLPVGILGDHLGFNSTVLILAGLFALLSTQLALLHWRSLRRIDPMKT
jgi:MFS family permease